MRRGPGNAGGRNSLSFQVNLISAVIDDDMSTDHTFTWPIDNLQRIYNPLTGTDITRVTSTNATDSQLE